MHVLNIITKVFIRGRQSIKGERRRFEDAALLVLKLEEGTMSPKDVGRLWKRERTYFVLEPPEGTQLCGPILDLTSRTVGE